MTVTLERTDPSVGSADDVKVTKLGGRIGARIDGVRLW